MAESINAEMRAALRDEKRLSVVVSKGRGAQGLRLLIDAIAADSKANKPATTKAAPRIPVPASPLTARELQILQLIAEGFHNRQIANKIHRSIKTVEKHRQNLHSKLSTHEVAGLTRQALAIGLMDKNKFTSQTLAKRTEHLTKRELEVLKLVAQGAGNKWIANELQRSIKTVDHHRENIMKKLGIHEVAGLTRFALAIGLL